jgi:hypothetical protein
MMANATASRNTKEYGQDVWPSLYSFPVAASKKIFARTMVGLNASGNCLSAGDPTAVKVVGVLDEPDIDNSSGAAGAVTAKRVRNGVFFFANSAGADAITVANVGQICYVVDDQTVALTDNNGSRLVAGIITVVDPNDGVGVLFLNEEISPYGVLAIAMDLTALPAGAGPTLVHTMTTSFSGRILRTSFSVSKAGAGANATATLQVSVDGTAVTGGVVTPTLATTTQGAELVGTVITAGAKFKKGSVLTITCATVTAFTGGNGTFYIHVG